MKPMNDFVQEKINAVDQFLDQILVCATPKRLTLQALPVYRQKYQYPEVSPLQLANAINFLQKHLKLNAVKLREMLKEEDHSELLQLLNNCVVVDDPLINTEALQNTKITDKNQQLVQLPVHTGRKQQYLLKITTDLCFDTTSKFKDSM